jgi:phage terminase small subunit
LDISSERVLRELALLGFANMMDYMTVTVDGQAYVDLSNLTRDQAAAIQEIKVDETGGGSGDNKREAVQRTTFRLANKKDALELLGKHLELFTDKHKFTGLDGLYERIAQARANAGRK